MDLVETLGIIFRYQIIKKKKHRRCIPMDRDLADAVDNIHIASIGRLRYFQHYLYWRY